MKHLNKLILGFIAIAALTACQSNDPSNDFANKLADKFIDAVNNSKYDEAFTMVEPEFFGVRAKDQWIEYYDAVKKEMGPIISIKLSRSLTDNRLSGRFYMYQYSIKHENGFTKEMVTMIKKINNNDPLKIAGHKIDSSKLLKINERY